MQNWRINLILIFIFLFGLAIIGRLFFIQIIKEDYYKALVQGQGLYNLEEEVAEERGGIFFKNGEPLAINMEWPLVVACPLEIKEKNETAEKLAAILELDKDLILGKLKKSSLYEVIKKKLSDEEIEEIKGLELAGVYLRKEVGRYYPQETLASQLVGFLDANKEGQYGLEGYYNETLKNNDQDLVLTIDYSIQFTAEELLKKAKETLNIEGGQIIVMDPKSGKILALANFPNFNPNQYSDYANEEKSEIFQNSITKKIFEPGSVFKGITMAAALEEGKVTPQTTYTDPGIIEIGGWPIYNYKQRTYPGEITMTEVLEKSINTGAVFAEQQLGSNLFLKYIEKFGIFEATGIDLQETCPENEELKKEHEISFATASYGQGIEMTSIQLARAYSVIANGGKLITPYIVEKGEEETQYEQIISPKISSQLTAMLISVVEAAYTKVAQVPGYYIAGKTGTAQISFSALGLDKEGYSDETWQSFVGFAPAFNPQFLILIKLDNPQTKTAEYSAVPIFHDLAKYIIDYWQIPPDYE